MQKIYFLLCLFTFLHIAPAGSAKETGPDDKPLFASDVIQPADVTVCAGATTTNILFTSTFPGTIFNWVNNNTSIGLAASGSGNIASFTTTNTSNAPIIATITVTPTDGVTNGIARTFTITVNPVPDVSPVPPQTICNNTATNAINFSGAVPGTNFSWTNTNQAIGLATSGSGNIPSFTATNTTGSPITGTITVTPTFGSIAPELLYYKFEEVGTTVTNLASNPPAGTATATLNGTMSQGGIGTCGGMLQSNGVTINDYLNTNWTPVVNSSWTISFISDGFSGATDGKVYDVFGSFNGFYCTYTEPLPGGNGLGRFDLYSSTNVISVEANFTTPKTVTFAYNNATQNITSYLNGSPQGAGSGNWSINIPSFYIGNVFGGTAGSIPAGSSIDEFRMYNRRLSPTEITELVNSCTVTGGCAGAATTFDITVLPSPIVDPVASQAVCTNTSTTAINFTGNVAGTTYDWTNSDPSIGLAANGTGNIPAFTAINPGSSTVTAIITVTPIGPGAPTCTGTPEQFTISVSPVPAGIATPSSQTICSESAIQSILFTGNIPGLTFDWTRDNLVTVTGIAAAGTGTISGTLTNTTNAPVTVTFTVTPSIGGCAGNPFTVTVTVNENLPVATASPLLQNLCSGTITDIILSSTVPGATLNWTRDNNVAVTGIAASGTGDITGTLFNTTNIPVTVTFTITPAFNGCNGDPITATVLVNAEPTISCPADIITSNATGLCGTTISFNPTVTGAPAPSLTYLLSGATTGSGNGSGSGLFFNVGVTTVTLVASNSCGTANCSFTVTVEDTEDPILTCPATIQVNTGAGICTATVVTPDPVATDNCAIATLTWVFSGATTGSSPLTGINKVGTAVFNKGTTTVTYTLKDAAGHSVTCSYTVTVSDAENPVITCSPNITVTTPTGTCVAEVAYTISATDNCPGVTTQLVSGPASGAAFPIGTTTITWRAIDAAGNISANCSFTVTVLDGQLPVISAPPINRTVCAGSSATFSVTATNVVTYQWQQWNGTAWVNINGANNSSYTINNATASMNGNTYRAVLNGLCTVVNSVAATLFVNPLPSISVSAISRTNLLPPHTTSIVATVSPTGGSFVWRKNGGIVVGTTSATLAPLTVDNIGTYNTTYTDPNGCIVVSPDIIIGAMPTENIWVYPNPSKGAFQVRYYNNFGEPATVVIYNAAGQRVYSKSFVIGEPYSRMDIDLRNQSAGIYIVKVISGNGKELAAKTIMVAH